MATRELAEWEKIDGSNSFPAEEGGWPEGMKRSDVNNAARADMGAMRRWYDDPEWLDLTVGATTAKGNNEVISVTGNFEEYFTTGRRVKITGGTPSPVYATVNAAQDVGAFTAVQLRDFEGHTEVPDTPGVIFCHITSSINSQAFLDPVFEIVTQLNAEGIQDKIDELEAAGGGVIALVPDATYTIEATLNIGLGASEGRIRIAGRGATLILEDALDDELLVIEDFASGVIDANVILEDIVFAGNAANQTVLSAGLGLLRIGANVSNVWLRNCGFNDSYGNCINITQGCHKIWAQDCIFDAMGEDGVHMTDTANTIDRIYIRGCSFENPSNTAAITEGAGIHFAGKVHISDCSFVNSDHGTNVQRGIHARVKSSGSPNDQSGRESTIVGCRFQGTGPAAVGVYLQGRDVMVNACQFNMSGSASRGVLVEYTGNESERHVITGCNFLNGDRGVRLENSAEDCQVSSCSFDGVEYPYTDNGIRNKIHGCVMTNGTDGVTVSASASNTQVSNNSIDTMSGVGIDVVGGATGAQIIDNIVLNATTAAVADSGTATGIRGGAAAYCETFINATEFVNLDASTTEQLVTDGAGNDFLVTVTNYADGGTTWIVDSAIIQGVWGADDNSLANVHFRLRHGTNSGGTVTNDTLITDGTIPNTGGSIGTAVNEGETWQFTLPQMEFTPDSGDDVYLTVVTEANTQDMDYSGSDSTPEAFSYFRVRPK